MASSTTLEDSSQKMNSILLLAVAVTLLSSAWASNENSAPASYPPLSSNRKIQTPNNVQSRRLSLVDDWSISLASKAYDDTNNLFRIVYNHGAAATGINVAFYAGGDATGSLVGASCRTGGGKKVGDLSNPPSGLNVSMTDGNSAATIEISIDLNTTRNDTDIATTSGSSLVVHFCVCTSLMNGQEEANFVEMELRFTQDSGDGAFTLAGDFETEALQAGSVEHSTTLSSLSAKLCDGMTQPIHPGTPVEICLESSDSLVSILGIKEFNFTTQGGVTQPAFQDGVADPLTEMITCSSGSACSFRTLLIADFYVDTTTPVSGSGTATLDTGSGRRRTLRFRMESENTSKETETAGLSLKIMLASDEETSSVIAYDKIVSGAHESQGFACALLLASVTFLSALLAHL